MAIHLLKTREVLTRPDGLHSDGAGLCLRVQSQGRSRSWVYRYRIGRTKKLISLGSVKELTLDQARKICSEINKSIARGEPPNQFLARKCHESNRLVSPYLATFSDILEGAVTAIAKVKRWRGARTESEWRQTLHDYALPILGDKDVAEIDSLDIVAVLDPIWETKNQTAKKVLSHLTAIFDWCQRLSTNKESGRVERASVFASPTKSRSSSEAFKSGSLVSRSSSSPSVISQGNKNFTRCTFRYAYRNTG